MLEGLLKDWVRNFQSRLDAADNAQAKVQGGIDLSGNEALLQEQGEAINFKVDPAMMARFQRGDFSGFVANIVSFSAVGNLPQVLGLTP